MRLMIVSEIQKKSITKGEENKYSTGIFPLKYRHFRLLQFILL